MPQSSSQISSEQKLWAALSYVWILSIVVLRATGHGVEGANSWRVVG